VVELPKDILDEDLVRVEQAVVDLEEDQLREKLQDARLQVVAA